MSKITPEQIAANIAASALKKKGDNNPPINNSEAVEAFRKKGGRILHYQGRRFKGVTIAFIRGGKTIEIATSVVHPSDVFTKKVGTKNAIERFNDGRTVVLPIFSNWDSVPFLRAIWN